MTECVAFSMDENDRLNLKFLLECSEETLKDWYEKTTEDDHKYASALMTCASWELLDDIDTVTEALEYLTKYRSNNEPRT